MDEQAKKNIEIHLERLKNNIHFQINRDVIDKINMAMKKNIDANKILYPFSKIKFINQLDQYFDLLLAGKDDDTLMYFSDINQSLCYLFFHYIKKNKINAQQLKIIKNLEFINKYQSDENIVKIESQVDMIIDAINNGIPEDGINTISNYLSDISEYTSHDNIISILEKTLEALYQKHNIEDLILCIGKEKKYMSINQFEVIYKEMMNKSLSNNQLAIVSNANYEKTTMVEMIRQIKKEPEKIESFHKINNLINNVDEHFEQYYRIDVGFFNQLNIFVDKFDVKITEQYKGILKNDSFGIKEVRAITHIINNTKAEVSVVEKIINLFKEDFFYYDEKKLLVLISFIGFLSSYAAKQHILNKMLNDMDYVGYMVDNIFKIMEEK